MGIEKVTEQLFRINHDDEDARTRFENFVQHFVENATQEAWTTMRYALEEYAQECEDKLMELLHTTNTEARRMSNRKPGHHEEVALAAELVTSCNEALMHFKMAQSETGADV